MSKTKKSDKKMAFGLSRLLANWTIGKRVMAGFLVVVTLTAISGVTGILNINTMGKAVERIAYDEAPTVDAANEMKIAMALSRNNMEEYKGATSTIANDDASAIEGIVAAYNQTVEDFDGFVTAILEGGEYDGVLVRATDNDELRALVEEADRIHNDLFQPASATLIDAGKKMLDQKAVVTEAMLAMEALYDEIQADAGLMEDRVKKMIAGKKKSLSAGALRILERDVPLADMTMEMKTSLGNSRIKLEEINQQTDIESIVALEEEYNETIVEFDQWVTGFLEGGDTDEGYVYAASDPRLRAGVQELDGDHTDFQTAADNLIAGQLEMVRLSDIANEAMEQLDMHGVRISDILDEVEQASGGEMAEAILSADTAELTATVTLIAVTIAAVVIGMLIGIFISRGITKPINLMVTGIQRLAANDLTATVDVQSTDETGVMASAFNEATGKLRDVLKRILSSSGQVENAANQISSASEQLAAGAEEQQAQLSEVATTMEQMSAMILEASKNADETRESAQHTGNTAAQGREVVSKTVTGFRTVADTVEQAAQQIQELNKRSEEIGNVIQVIDDIADQTNLLALNANIEAARAGDAGRGFAVVADEVRKLAERTVSATAEISNMIESIQGDIKAAVVSMEQIQGQSKEGLELVAQSDKSLEEIAGSIINVVSAVEQIATSTNEQSSGAEEISKNIEGVTTVAKESASSAQELAASAEQLNKEVQGLNELIGQFKVD